LKRKKNGGNSSSLVRIKRTESSDLLSVLDQLHPDALSNSRVRLLGFDTDLLEHNTLGMGRTTEGRRLICGSEEALLVVQVGPATFATVVPQLAGGVESSWLAFTHGGYCYVRVWAIESIPRFRLSMR